jgi:plasmid maintenance system antidote protein VapI
MAHRTAESWLTLQTAYDLAQARLRWVDPPIKQLAPKVA